MHSLIDQEYKLVYHLHKYLEAQREYFKTSHEIVNKLLPDIVALHENKLRDYEKHLAVQEQVKG